MVAVQARLAGIVVVRAILARVLLECILIGLLLIEGVRECWVAVVVPSSSGCK